MRDGVMIMTQTMLRPATEPQLKYIRDLAAKVPNWYPQVDGTVGDTILDVLGNVGNPDPKFVAFAEASAALDALIPLAKAVPAVTPAHAGSDDWKQLCQLLKQINPGKYALPRKKDGEVDFFEVIERKNGVRFLNQLLGGGNKFNRKQLSNHLQACAARAILGDQKAAARLFAEKTETCPRCSTGLTHPRSIATKIGPNCAIAWGWTW